MGGGGGAIRTAAKIAGINAGLRSASPAEHIASGARRAATRPVAEEVSWTGLSASQTSSSIDAAAQRPSWELDDWEFAGGERDTVVVTGEPLPRVVFGGVPTIEEAKEASKELKDALQKMYFSSSNSTGYKEAGHESALSMTPNPDYLENKVCVISNSTTDSLPTNALKAFRLFSETPAAQSVVASIASDPNVWNAVLQNEALSEFLQSQKSSVPLLDNGSVTEEFVADANRISENSYGSRDENGFINFLDGVKTSVVSMVNSFSDYFQNLFGAPSSEKDNTETDASARASNSEITMGTKILGLAIIVIMIVVLKRP